MQVAGEVQRANFLLARETVAYSVREYLQASRVSRSKDVENRNYLEVKGRHPTALMLTCIGRVA